jgi:hypothetical protein
MVAKFSSKIHLQNMFFRYFEPFRPPLTSSLQKKCYYCMIKKFRKSNMPIKNEEISNIIEASKNLDFDFFINKSSKNFKKRCTQKGLI